MDTITALFRTALSSVEGVFALVGTLIANIGELAKGFVNLILGMWTVAAAVICPLICLPGSVTVCFLFGKGLGMCERRAGHDGIRWVVSAVQECFLLFH